MKDTPTKAIATGESIVAWTTPMQRAEKALQRAGEELETGSRMKAWFFIGQALVHIVDLQRFLIANPHAGRRP